MQADVANSWARVSHRPGAGRCDPDDHRTCEHTHETSCLRLSFGGNCPGRWISGNLQCKPHALRAPAYVEDGGRLGRSLVLPYMAMSPIKSQTIPRAPPHIEISIGYFLPPSSFLHPE